jgi:hypothetical protein
VIFDLTGVGLAREPRNLAFSDLTASEVTGPYQWINEGQLDIPFDPEPTPDEAVRIRRRLVTVDADAEYRVNCLAEIAETLGSDTSPTAQAVLLLIQERLSELREPVDTTTQRSR